MGWLSAAWAGSKVAGRVAGGWLRENWSWIWRVLLGLAAVAAIWFLVIAPRLEIERLNQEKAKTELDAVKQEVETQRQAATRQRQLEEAALTRIQQQNTAVSAAGGGVAAIQERVEAADRAGRSVERVDDTTQDVLDRLARLQEGMQ